MKYVLLLFILNISWLSAKDHVLFAHARKRPPEITVDEKIDGPLVKIINTAAERAGYTIKWDLAHFSRSLKDLESGEVDIVPRVIYRKERAVYAKYFTPILEQKKDISFVVKKGKEHKIKDYSDLYNYLIGIKRGTVYFEKFDNDNELDKVKSYDDYNLVLMLYTDRIDSFVVLDKEAAEKEFKANRISDYTYADYIHTEVIKNCYAFSKKSRNPDAYEKIEKELQIMIKNKEIEKIYSEYGLDVE